MTDWYYESRQGGRRLGPFRDDNIASLIKDGEIDSATLVWNASMQQWENVIKTSLAQHFGVRPPPLPLTALPSWPAYALAAVPLLFGQVESFVSSSLPPSMSIDARSFWTTAIPLVVTVIVNTILANVDTKNLLNAGVALRGGWLWAIIFVPAYLFIRGTSLRRMYATGHLQTFYLLYAYVFVLVLSLLI